MKPVALADHKRPLYGVAAIYVFLLCGLTFCGSVLADATRFAFGVNGEDFSLSRYRIDGEGHLRHLGHIPIDKAPSNVVVDPSGRFVLAVSNTADTLWVFYLNPVSGELKSVPGSPFATGLRSPFSIRFHPSGKFVYLGGRFSGVGAYRFDSITGAIQPIAGTPFVAQRRTREIALHPSGKFLYAINAYSNSISAYYIDPDSGALSQLLGSPYSAGDFGAIDYPSLNMGDVPPTAGGIPLSIDVDPQGRFVFVANKAAASVSVFAVNPQTGSLSAVAGSPFFVGFNPYRLRVHPSGRFLFVTLWSDAKVSVLSLDGDSGRLTPVKGSPFSTGAAAPVEVSFSEKGDRAYVSNYDGNMITQFDVDTESGELWLAEMVATRMGPWSLAVTAGMEDRRQMAPPLLLAARGDRGIAVFRAERGVLSLLESVDREGDIVAAASSPNGKFVFALDEAGESIYSYRVDVGTARLQPVPNGVVKTGRAPRAMFVDTLGWYLYVTNSGGRTMSTYFIDPNTGVLDLVRGSPVFAGLGPAKIAQDPAARYAFVINEQSRDISSYRHMNAVTPLIFEGRKYGSPFAAGKEPVDMVVEPTGRFAYVADAGSGEISVFHIHHKSGGLSAVPGSPFPVGGRPVALALHASGDFLYVANAGTQTISIMPLEKRFGALAKGAVSIPLPMAPQSLYLDEREEVLYVLADGGRRLLSFAVEEKGAKLQPLAEQRFTQPILELAPLPSSGK